MRRKLISIDETKCTGCEKCIPGCPEGAIQVIDGKARLVSDLICDGLGACQGQFPEGANMIEERGTPPFLEGLVRELREPRYKAGPVRRVYIPKNQWQTATAGHPR